MSMALTINPAGSGTRSKWLADTGAFFVGALLGALASAAVIITAVGLLSLFVPRAWLPVTVLPLAGLAVLRELGLPVPLPYRNQQVPEWWRSVLPTRLVSLAYGLVLGFGFATLFTSAAHTVVLLALPFVDSAWALLAILAVYAAGKTIILYLGQGAGSHDDVLNRLTVAENASTPRRWARRLTALGASAVVLAALLQAG
jgi:hypothetical protein